MKNLQLHPADSRPSLRSPLSTKAHGFRAARGALVAGLALALGTVALPAAAANWWSAAPSVSIGSTTVNVRNAGALGNGQHNDTAAFQAAINSLPTTGGTIVVPAGTYMIDAVRSINLRSHVRLQLNAGAQLVALPNSAERSSVINAVRVTDVEISGGSIVGERVGHRGTTGEWGMGINVLGSSKVYVHDLKVSNCWGDGLYIGSYGSAGKATLSSGVTVKNVVSDSNRRQGLSIASAKNVYVLKSTFSNSHGTKPEAGIDIEPMPARGPAQDIRVEASNLIGNAGGGIEVQAYVSGLVLKWNTINSNGGFGVYGNAASDIVIAGNIISENWLFGVSLASTTHNVGIIDNKITYNSTRGFYLHNKSIYQLVSGARDIDVAGTTWNVQVARNTITAKP